MYSFFTTEITESLNNEIGRNFMSIQVMKRLFTVNEYYRMAEVGILGEDDRVELIVRSSQ